MKNILKIASFLTVLILIASPIIALAGGPGFGGGVDDGGNSCAAPLDGGMSLLIATGLAYGVKKLNKKKSKQNINV